MTMESNSSYFSGPDRVEFSPIFGRPLRMGENVAKGVSDLARMRELLDSGNAKEALELGGLLHAINTAVVSTFLEWCLALPNILNQQSGEEVERGISAAAYNLWQDGLKAHNEIAGNELREILATNSLNANSIVEFRKLASQGAANSAAHLLGLPNKLFSEVSTSISQEDFIKAKSTFEEYTIQTRERHDLCGEFISTFGSVMSNKIGEQSSVHILQEGLESCPLLGEMWKAVAVLDAASLAAMLAEHLRHHFSGAGREGSVQVVEEADRYRLVFAPCGTGGAMRQRNIKGLGILKDPAPSTWNLSNQVPAYCSHCAKNELTSLEKLGSIAWVTEFTADPNTPCGWTVYKDRSKVPQKYFERLGVQQ